MSTLCVQLLAFGEEKMERGNREEAHQTKEEKRGTYIYFWGRA